MQIASNTLCHNHNQDLKNSSVLNFLDSTQCSVPESVHTPSAQKGLQILGGVVGGEDQGPKTFKEEYEVIFIPEGWGGIFSGKFLYVGVVKG